MRTPDIGIVTSRWTLVGLACVWIATTLLALAFGIASVYVWLMAAVAVANTLYMLFTWRKSRFQRR